MMKQLKNVEKTYNPEKEQAWRQVIAEWRRSGQSQVAFCRDRQISRYRFVYWKRRLESNGISMEKVSLVQVADISGREVQAGMMRRTPETMFFTVNGKYRIEVGEGFGGETLKRLLDVLEGR
jgi:transposase